MLPDITKQEAIEVFGTQAALARALGISRQAVNKRKDGPVPDSWELRLRYELRPDVWLKQHA